MSGRALSFLCEPRAPRPLGVFRIGVSLLLLIQAWTLSEHLVLLLDNRGLAPWSVSEVISSAWLPHIASVARALRPFGLSARACIQGIGAVYVLCLVGLLLGWRYGAQRPAKLPAVIG